MQELAFCLANGRGAKKDRKEAARWYREAVRAPLSHSRGPLVLTRMFRSRLGRATSGSRGYTRINLWTRACIHWDGDLYIGWAVCMQLDFNHCSRLYRHNPASFPATPRDRPAPTLPAALASPFVALWVSAYDRVPELGQWQVVDDGLAFSIDKPDPLHGEQNRELEDLLHVFAVLIFAGVF
jgi:hypothetical protein